MSLSFSWTEYADGRIFVAQPDQKPREAIGHEAEILRKLRDLNVELEAANGISELRLDDAREFKRERDEHALVSQRRFEALQEKIAHADEAGSYAVSLQSALGSLQEMLAKQVVGIPEKDRPLCCACGKFDPDHDADCPVSRGLAIIDAAFAANPVNEIGTKSNPVGENDVEAARTEQGMPRGPSGVVVPGHDPGDPATVVTGRRDGHSNSVLAVGIDSDARWKEVQAICDRVARADGMPDEVGSALCWAVTQLRESRHSQGTIK